MLRVNRAFVIAGSKVSTMFLQLVAYTYCFLQTSIYIFLFSSPDVAPAAGASGGRSSGSRHGANGAAAKRKEHEAAGREAFEDDYSGSDDEGAGAIGAERRPIYTGALGACDNSEYDLDL